MTLRVDADPATDWLLLHSRIDQAGEGHVATRVASVAGTTATEAGDSARLVSATAPLMVQVLVIDGNRRTHTRIVESDGCDVAVT